MSSLVQVHSDCVVVIAHTHSLPPTAMGGDSFPDTERLSEEEYVRTCQVISKCLREQDLEICIPVEVKDKAEICRVRGREKPYGDVDIIVGLASQEKRKDIVRKVMEVVSGDHDEIHENDSTFSFLTAERFQVDIKFCGKENLSFLAAFKSNNDFGALLGHLLTPLSLKWSEKGLMLKLREENVSGVGAVKADLLLTKEPVEVCQFLGIPTHSLDGQTRLSCREIFDILTQCRAFFPQDYDEKYKIKERRKKRPVSDTFFAYLEESNIEQLKKEKMELFEKDKVEMLFRRYRDREIESSDYLQQVAAYFSLQEDLQSKLKEMKRKIQDSSVHPKFNYRTLVDWYPDLSPNLLGKMLGKIKCSHSGSGKESFTHWIESTELEDIRREVESIRNNV